MNIKDIDYSWLMQTTYTEKVIKIQEVHLSQFVKILSSKLENLGLIFQVQISKAGLNK